MHIQAKHHLPCPPHHYCGDSSSSSASGRGNSSHSSSCSCGGSGSCRSSESGIAASKHYSGGGGESSSGGGSDSGSNSGSDRGSNSSSDSAATLVSHGLFWSHALPVRQSLVATSLLDTYPSLHSHALSITSINTRRISHCHQSQLTATTRQIILT
eukprot:12104705-Ditylum_brightwellii.AAC.1